MAGRMPASGNARKPWRSTRVAQQLGIDYPIIQAPFGGLPSQRLTATVSNLGGLGSLGAVTLGASAISEVIGEIRSLTSKPFAINLWVSTSDREASHIGLGVIQERICALARYYAELGIEPPSKVEAKPQDYETQVRAVIDAGVPALSFIYGIPPAEILDECHKRKIKTIGTATTPEEASTLEQAGFALIPQVADIVKLPVIAAGGIADGRGLAAAFALGAEGVQIGTAFLPCAGSGASKTYRTALSLFAANGTDLTDAFTGRLARGIRNRLMNEFRHVSSPPLPFPVQHALTQTVATPASAQGALELMTIWAGQNASLCHSTDATEFMTQLIAEAETVFSKEE